MYMTQYCTIAESVFCVVKGVTAPDIDAQKTGIEGESAHLDGATDVAHRVPVGAVLYLV